MNLSVGVGMLGCGTVGARVAERLVQHRAELEMRSGVRYELRAIAVRDPQKPRPSSLDRRLFTRDLSAVVGDPHIDVLVELIGGTNDAAECVERALDRGRHVVTANKDLLATQGPRLQALAAARGSGLRFEGAVAGAIPIVRTIREALGGDEILSVAGVVNGTSTAILSAMEGGADFSLALETARELGYAEADSTNDIDGTDAAHKLALMIQLAFGLAVISPRIRRRGIGALTRRTIARAASLGYRIRLVAAAVRTRGGAAAEVAPVLVPDQHEFARTAGAENAVVVTARDAGRLVLRGTGAGGEATSSAVLGDVMSILRGISERGGSGLSGSRRPFDPAIEVDALFERFALAHEHELQCPIWDDTVLGVAESVLA